MAAKKATPKTKRGRPKKAVSILWDGWQDQLLELYREGASHEEVKGFIVGECIDRGIDCAISNGLWKRWMTDEPEFSQTIKRGQHLSQMWWLKNGRTNLQNKEFSPTLWYMNMKNRFGWSDKTESKTEHSGKVEIPGLAWARK